MSRVTTIMPLLVVTILLALVAFYYHGESVSSAGKVSQLESDNNLQSATLATQSFHFQKFNEIAANATQYSTNIKAKTQEREIEYRTILKSEPTCALPIPTDIANGLYDYANRLRASAMHADPGQPDSANPRTTTASITYCQAVLWIDPLLAAIDQANNQFAGIRQIEADRLFQ